MKISQTKAEELVGLALDIQERMRGLGSLSIEIDDQTGIQFVSQCGAFGATVDMPRDLSQKYLAFELGEMIEQESVQRN